jgi:hypothetical protein
MTAGPALMALGCLWLTRIPANSQAWLLNPGHPDTFFPPASYFTDILPGLLLFGAGLMMMVAPLTTAVMTSVPSHNSGLASAINNAISRIGPQLAGALIFIAITSAFYASLASHAPALDVNSPDVRREVSPLNRPGVPLNPAQAQAVKQASSDAFHLAMFASAGLLAAGAVVAGIGIRTQAPDAPAPAPDPGRPAEEPTAEPGPQPREGSQPRPADQPAG